MKKTIIPLTVIAMACGSALTVRGQEDGSHLNSRAQRDTSRIDIGWLTLDKELTQTITIKGSDLEKMPFVNLSDAISAWLYGAYTKPGTLAYVVDGNPVTDVNSYSVFDIEEVTFMETAAGGAAYGGTQQELVVITTRKGKGKCGMRVAGQGGAINSNGDGNTTKTNFYQQYYLGAYRNYDKLSVGISADWVRDVVPMPSGAQYQVTTPENLQRLRLNGYLTWRPTNKDFIELRVGYAPQWINEALDSSSSSDSRQVAYKVHEHLLTPEIRWNRQLAKGLANTLRVSDLNESAFSGFSLIDSAIGGAYPLQGAEDTGLARINHFFVRDRLSYELTVGNWGILPSLNFSYDQITEKTATAGESVGFNNGQFVFVENPVGPWQKQTADLLYLTPAFDIRLPRAIDLQFGAQVNISSKRDTGSKVLYPFATIGMDVLHFVRKAGGPSLKLFGSYAERQLVFLDDYSLVDFSGGGGSYSLADVFEPNYTTVSFGFTNPFGGGTIETSQIPNEPRPLFWTWEAGAAFTTAGGRLQVQYTFEKRNLVTPGGISFVDASGNGLTELPEWKSTLHHIDLRFNVMDSTAVTWLTGINLTLLQTRMYNFNIPTNINFSSVFESYQFPQAGDYYPAHLSYSGGWVNRWKVGNFSAGLDLMYRFGESEIVSNGYGTNFNGPKINSVLLSNVYVGNTWRLRGTRAFELFVESRGLARSKSSDLLDDRRYYTIGGKWTM